MPPLWRPGGAWDDPATLGSARMDTLRSRLGFLAIFDGSSDVILKAFWVPWIKEVVFCHACFQVPFSDNFWV